MSEMPALAASCVPRSVSSGRSADEDDSKRFPVVRRGVPETAATNSRRMASAGEGWLPGRPPEVLPAGGEDRDKSGGAQVCAGEGLGLMASLSDGVERYKLESHTPDQR